MLVGLTTVTLLTGESAIKGYISMLLGLMLAVVGFDIVSGRAAVRVRHSRDDGRDRLPAGRDRPVRVGRGAGRRRRGQGTLDPARPLRPARRHAERATGRAAAGPSPAARCWAFSSASCPGAGPTVSTFLSYAVEKKVSRHPEEFGKGAIEGVAGPESANNAAATGAMVPMLTLGIPGSATTAIMLGGLMMWGLRPGPLLFEKNPQFVWGLIASQYIANVMLLVLSTAFIPLFVRALRVPYGILMPVIVIFCVTGAYSLKNNVFDVGQMLAFGVLGYAMKKLGYSPAALVLALVLGPLAERALRQSLIISDSGIAIFFTAADRRHADRRRACWRCGVPAVSAIVAASRRRRAARGG